MKKALKTFVMLIAIAIIAGSASTVRADSGLTLTQKTYVTYNGRTEAKFYTSRGYGYCITPERTGAGQGHYFSYSYEEKDGGLLYLLEKGASDDKTYLITQLAIWKYRSNFMPAAFVGTSYGNTAANWANEAKKHTSYSSSAVKVSLNQTDVKVSLTNNGYYQTNYISAKTTGSSTYTINVSGVNNYQIINASGKTISNGATLNSGDKFYIRVPYASLTTKSTIKVVFNTNGTEKIIKRYSPNNSKLQDIVVLEKTNKSSSLTVNLVVTPTKKVCEYYNGKYYDKNGKETTKVVYQQQCEKNICKKVGDKYYDKNGKETTKVVYQQQCEKNICKKVGDKYYDKNGKETTKVVYQQQCEKNICKKVGDKYFDKNGKETNEITYKQQCENNICKKVGDKYFDKNGKETDEITYKQQCDSNICKKVGDKYFDKNGKETNEITYRQQCDTNICKIVGDKYFGQDGKETDETTYRQQCDTNICKVVGDKYFGKDGLEVTYSVYKAECDVPVPDTGVSATKSIISIIFGVLVIAGTIVGIKKYNK